MKQPSYSSEIRPADGFRRVLGAYEIRGFDTAAIRQWCIPELDAEMLVEATRAQRPKRILEVGTYVGVSTLLMALADPAATIVTIDPNLRLAAEALAPSGVILMHDCIGMWGTNVRAGIFRFLADRSEFRLSHPRFSELYRSIGFVFRADEHPDLMKRFRSSEPDASA